MEGVELAAGSMEGSAVPQGMEQGQQPHQTDGPRPPGEKKLQDGEVARCSL